jgi:hypothetical protein
MRLSEGIRWCAIQFEPEAGGCVDAGFRSGASQIASHDAQIKLDGWEVLEAWGLLPEALRAAILGIVRSVTGGEPKRSAEPVPPEPQGLRGGVSPSPLPVRGAPFQNGKRREAR